jgi:NADH-quinone oxidoreductase subunit I
MNKQIFLNKNYKDVIRNHILIRKKKQVSKEMTFRAFIYCRDCQRFDHYHQAFIYKKSDHTIPEQVRVMSPVYRGQHMLKRDEQRENCTGLCAFILQSDKQKSKKTDENIYMKKICLDI